ncbi:MAG: hypothetical protein QOH76_3591, partial [Thermoleophilaceae bacterium]|nr:hypothetical protein [Thermoleophilaceae bacterium]
EHFEAVVERVGRGEVVEVGGTGAAPLFPVEVTSDPYVHPDSPGISGGFLLTNGHALRSVPLLRSYNEDWIWLRQLRARGGAVHRFGFSVVHAGATHFGFSVRGLLTQFDGEVLDQALVLGSVDEALRGCRARLHAVVERAAAVSVVAAGYAPAAVAVGIQTLERVAVEVGRRSAAGYCATLDRHLERSDRWRDAFTADPTLCASSQSALSPLTGTGRLLWT